MSKLIGLIKRLDFFTVPIHLKIDRVSSFKSSFGGIITVIMLIAFLSLFISMLNLVITKKNQYITTEEKYFSDPPELILTQTTPSVYNNSTNHFFFYALGMYRKDDLYEGYLSYEQFSNYFFVKAEDSSIINGGRANITNTYSLKQCDLNITESIEYSYSNIKNDLQKMVCLPTNQVNVIQGEFFSQVFKYLKIRIFPCAQEDNLNDNIRSCKIKLLNDINFLGEHILDIYTFTYALDKSLVGSGEAPMYRIIEKRSYPISTVRALKFNYYVSADKVTTYQDLFFGLSGIETFYATKVTFVEQSYDIIKDYYASITIRSSFSNMNIIRRFDDILTLLALIGGFILLLLFLGSIIAYPVNYQLLMFQVANKLFSLVTPGHQNVGDNAIFQDDNILGSEDKILKSLYENEIIEGVNLKLCENLNMKKNQIEQSKVSISSLLSFAEKNIIECYKAKNVFKTNSEIGSMLDFLLGEDKLLVGSGQNSKIDNESCLKITNDIKEYFMEQEQTEKIRSKALKMLVGLRGLKAKTYLDEIVDVNIIDELKSVDREDFLNYFIAQRKQLEEKFKSASQIEEEKQKIESIILSPKKLKDYLDRIEH